MKPPKRNPSASFKEYIEESLQGLPGLRVRSMFGGYGFYLGGAFFGIIWKGQLFFKTDDETRVEYLAEGSIPFDPPGPHRGKTSMTYYRVPESVFEHAEELQAWAKRSAQVANLTAKKKLL